MTQGIEESKVATAITKPLVSLTKEDEPLDFSQKNVMKMIDFMKKGKAPGADGLPAKIFQCSGICYHSMLARLFTLIDAAAVMLEE